MICWVCLQLGHTATLATLIKMCLNVIEAVCSPRIKQKLFDQFDQTTKQLNLDLCICERIVEIPTFTVSTHEYMHLFFFSIEIFRDREVFTQKEVMFQEKGTQTRRRKVNSNAEVIFQCVTG